MHFECQVSKACFWFKQRSAAVVYGPSNHIKLTSRWYFKVIRIHHDILIRKKCDNQTVARPSEAFFNAVASLLYNQLLSLITASKNEYISLFRGYKSDIQKVGDPRMPRFLMRVSCGKSTVIEYDPPVSELYEVMEAGLGFVLHTMDSLPRPEYILYGPLCDQLFMADIQKDSNKETQFSFVNNGGPEIKVLFEPKEAEVASQRLQNIASFCFDKVKHHLKLYDQYLNLFSKEVEDEVSAFVQQEHSFEEFAEVISRMYL